MTKSAVDGYFEQLESVLGQVRAQQHAIDNAAAIVATAVRNSGVVHTFGTGHSHLLAEEVFYRAGGLVPINPIQDRRISLSEGALASTAAEREEGLAAGLLAEADARSEDAAIVISNSGRNAAPVEAARCFRDKGISVIALTSMRHSRSVDARNSLGLKLYEIADVVLDNGGVPGDAGVQVAGVTHPMGPTSTAAGSALLHAVCIRATELLVEAQEPPVIFPSANSAASDTDAVRAAVEAIRPRVPCL